MKECVPQVFLIFGIHVAELNVAKWFTDMSELLTEISPNSSEKRQEILG